MAFYQNMSRLRQVAVWVLRLAVSAEFAWHGILALRGEQEWLGWFPRFGVADAQLASRLLFLIGLLDLTVAAIILIKPLRPVIVWAVIWGTWTAIVETITSGQAMEFFEEWANWGLPLALLVFFKTKTRVKQRGLIGKNKN
ncbi:MAG: hypothetical protein AAB642_03610 [Patescibacteria group bacterium]